MKNPPTSNRLIHHVSNAAFRPLVVGVVVLLSASAMHGQTAAHYRDFKLGGDLASVSALTGVPASDAKTTHTRPASLQELDWMRPYGGRGENAADPVQEIAFSFYNDQLFRLVIDYDRNRTEGMTDVDMIEAISTLYGTPVKPAVKADRARLAAIDEESGTRVAGWGDAEYDAVLYRSSFATRFRLVVTSVRLNAFAQRAEAQALELEEREAPQRERARQQKEVDDERATQAKARVANKAVFRP